jgi:hypothetical protein
LQNHSRAANNKNILNSCFILYTQWKLYLNMRDGWDRINLIFDSADCENQIIAIRLEAGITSPILHPHSTVFPPEANWNLMTVHILDQQVFLACMLRVSNFIHMAGAPLQPSQSMHTRCLLYESCEVARQSMRENSNLLANCKSVLNPLLIRILYFKFDPIRYTYCV